VYQRRGFESQTRENNIETKNNISDKKSNTVELNSQAYILNYLIQLSILSESGAFVAVIAW
jgi:hypothetical protein